MRFAETSRYAEVALSETEIAQLRVLAKERTAQAQARGSKNIGGLTKNTDKAFQDHTEFVGIASEIIVAAYMELPWSGREECDSVDVGENVQVRCGVGGHNKGLICYAKDRDSQVFVCVTEDRYVFRIHGWMFGHEAKSPHFWNTAQLRKCPAYLVPQSKLRDYRLLVPQAQVTAVSA